MGTSNLGWLQSRFHFSFADYYNPSNMNFGVLRVLNDDLIAANTGFDTHPHRDMEIITYVIDGELSHADSMGNMRSIGRGEVQYMSAGTGILHSEHNRGNSTARLLQTWILPDRKGHQPHYGDFRFAWKDRQNKWLALVSSIEGFAPVHIHQDAQFSVIELEAGNESYYPVPIGRQAYLVQIEGSSSINEIVLSDGDAMEIVEESIRIKALSQSHIYLIEMAKS